MATRKPKAKATEAPKDTAADGAIDVQGTETVTETPVDDVTKETTDTASETSTETPTEDTKSEDPAPDEAQTDAKPEASDEGNDDGDAADLSEEVNPGAPGVIKTVTPTVEGLTEDDMDLSKLTAIINPDRSGYDGVLKQGDRTIANIDCGPESASAADIKADLVAAGMPEENIQVLRD